MDALRADDLEMASTTPPDEKLRQALAMMEAGFALYRAGLRARFPDATDAELDAMFVRWLARDE